tara:strand:+ start:774 stop:1403 length:630 start_codon:yes stop_codon:yes gene_type:complete
MALTGKSVAETYKDLLTVSGETANQGLESTRKRVFDGEGIGSPIYLGTTSVEFQGPITTTNNLTVGGDIVYTGSISGNGSGLTNLPATEWDGSRTGNSSIIGDLTLTGNITAKEIYMRPINSLGSGVKVGALNSSNELQLYVDLITKGSSTKGNLVLADTSVSLKKGTDTLLEAKEDGSLVIRTVSEFPSSPNAGDIVNNGGSLYINVV